MKRSPLRFTTLALALALSITCWSIAPAAHADGKSAWNPVSWFSGDAADAAQKKADQAQEEADRARLQADKAEERAQQAKAAAQQAAQQTTARDAQQEARQQTETPTARQATRPLNTKPMVMAPANDSEAAVDAYWASEGKSIWNPKNWFGNKTETQAAATAVSTPRKQETPAKDADPDSEDKANNGWNFFSKADKETPKPAKHQKEAAKTAAVIEPQVNPSLKSKAALIETEKGNIAIELYPDDAPKTVANFAKLIDEGFYNRYNMKFHRVVPGFVIQTGDPTGTGAGGSKERIPLEVKNKLSHNTKGMVAMARGLDPNSATSQFYITLAPQTTLDGKYAVFGKVISGLDVLDKIGVGDMLYGIRLVDVSTITRDPQPEKKHFFSSLLPGSKESAQ